MDGLQQALQSQIEGEVRFDKISRALYSTDASVYQIMPRGVVIPRTADDVLRTVNVCREHGVSITARGGGTSQAGQACGRGIQLDFSKYLNRLLELVPDAKTVTVEPGIVLDELNALLQPYGLHLPLDLSTSNRATIGGMIANNSSGTRSVVYGKTLDYVEELTVVLADGSVVELQSLTADELDDRCRSNDSAGECHRVVRKLAAEQADEIRRRYPKILRRVGGYNLDEFVDGNKPFNLSRLIVGSEGTLAIVTKAKMRLVPLPQARGVCVVQFNTLLDALAATPLILEHNPSAVELMDRFVLDTTRGKREFEPLRDFIVGEPGAILIIEFFGETPDELPARFEQLEADLRSRGFSRHFHRAVQPDAQARIWKLRRAALGLSMSQRGDGKAISFVEDTAVAPGRLRDYIERFTEILEEHDTQAGFYAHASVGLLHVRPVVNMKTSLGVETFARIAEQVAELVLEFGGALSGEHGDGLVRSSFQQKMYGPKLYDAFCEIKRTFDPHNLLNPGKIVNAPPLVENLRFGTGYETRQLATVFDFSDFGGISRAAEQCGGVGACRKTLTGSMCPSYMATRDEADSTRGRANALRLAISGQFGPDAMTDRELFRVLDLCLECKTCKTECPTGVDMARMKAEFLYQYYGKQGIPRRVRLLAHVDQIAAWGSRFAPVSNWLAENRIVRRLHETLFGLDRRRSAPRFVRQTFLKWWANHREPQNNDDRPTVALFADTFTNYHEPQHAVAAVRLAWRLGFNVVVPQRVCCGRPLISKGLLEQARQQAEATTHALTALVDRGIPIVFCEPSCYSAVRDDHPQLLRGEIQERAKLVSASCLTFEEWANAALAAAKTLLFASAPKQILLHAHCHQKALVGTSAAVAVLSAIPGAVVTDLDAGCCGMAGSFGYEREHYDVSRAIGERQLFPAVRERGPDEVVVAPGFSCRHQISHFTGVKATSTAELLQRLLVGE